jgi:DNA-binding XRE family transcriptional regulator
MNQEISLRAKRIKRGWTQRYVGQKVGISKQAIHDIETGKQKPSYSVLFKLLALFNVEHKDISQLFAPVEETHINSNTDKEAMEALKNSAATADVSEASSGAIREGRATQERDGATAK